MGVATAKEARRQVRAWAPGLDVAPNGLHDSPSTTGELCYSHLVGHWLISAPISEYHIEHRIIHITAGMGTISNPLSKNCQAQTKACIATDKLLNCGVTPDEAPRNTARSYKRTTLFPHQSCSAAHAQHRLKCCLRTSRFWVFKYYCQAQRCLGFHQDY